MIRFLLFAVWIVFAMCTVSATAWLLNQDSDVALIAGFVLFVLFCALTAYIVRHWVWPHLKGLIDSMNKLILFLFSLTMIGCAGCERVDVGNVGIKINKAGSNRGVQDIPMVSGYVFYNPFTESVLEYPVYMQTVVWDKNDSDGRNEELSFNSSEGLSITGDISLSYQLVAEQVPQFYVKFRSDDLDKFTHGFLRNVARDQFNEVAGTFSIENLYGPKKEEFVQTVHRRLNDRLKEIGVRIEQIGFIGAPRPPQGVINAINAKIAATQQAIQRENELRMTEAEAKKAIAEAQGQASSQVARAEGEAKSRLARAEGEAKANRVLVQSLTPELMEWRRLEIQSAATSKWNGQLPSVDLGGSGKNLLFQLPAVKDK